MSGGKVTLESRQKLPQKVQDVICDVGLAIQNSMQVSPAPECINNTLKTMAAADVNIETTTNNLQQIDDLLDQLDASYNNIQNNIGQMTDVMDRLQNIERHKYFCAESNKEAESDFDKSDQEARQ